MFGIGIIGAGSFGEEHARALGELSNARLVAAARTNAAALEEFTRRYGGRGYLDYQALLDDAQVDVVVIATPHHLHTEIAERAARAGKHILLEKPMAPNLAECDRIVQAARQAHVELMVGFTNHFARAYQVAKRLLESGEMGQVVLGVSSMSKYWYEPNRREWHLDRATGGGAWLTAGIHCLDRLTWLVDSPIVQVYAQFDTRFHEQSADDVGLVSVRYASGAMGAIVSTGYATGASKFLTELTCTKGMLNIDYVTGVTIGREERWQAVPDSGSPAWMHEALVEEWRAFLSALEQGAAAPVNGEYGRAIMAAAFAAETSSRRQAAVQLD